MWMSTTEPVGFKMAWPWNIYQTYQTSDNLGFTATVIVSVRTGGFISQKEWEILSLMYTHDYICIKKCRYTYMYIYMYIASLTWENGDTSLELGALHVRTDTKDDNSKETICRVIQAVSASIELLGTWDEFVNFQNSLACIRANTRTGVNISWYIFVHLCASYVL